MLSDEPLSWTSDLSRRCSMRLRLRRYARSIRCHKDVIEHLELEPCPLQIQIRPQAYACIIIQSPPCSRHRPIEGYTTRYQTLGAGRTTITSRHGVARQDRVRRYGPWRLCKPRRTRGSRCPTFWDQDFEVLKSFWDWWPQTWASVSREKSRTVLLKSEIL